MHSVLCYSPSMAPLQIFTGEGRFGLREERCLWKERFREKHGDQNLSVLDGQKLTYRQLLDEISAAPFLGEKRLVIVDGFPRLEKEQAEALSAELHPDCVLLLCDPKPDKRLGGVKVLLKVAAVKEFPPLKGSALRTWMKTHASQTGSSIDDMAAAALITTAGEDQDMLAQEIAKLSLAAGKGPITAELVSHLAVPSGEQEIWHLSSLIASGDSAGAIRYGRTLLEQGEDPFSLWSIMLWQLRMLAAVHASVRDGERNPAKIASSASVPFPTARTLLPLADAASTSALSNVHAWAVDADIDLKTGVLRSTAEAPQELLALIDTLILRLASLKTQK